MVDDDNDVTDSTLEAARAVAERYRGERKIVSTTTEKLHRPISQEDDLPQQEDYSEPEIKSIKATSDMTAGDLSILIGTAGYEDWAIQVLRQGPSNYMGYAVGKEMVIRSKLPCTLGDLEDEIRDNHGGGKYMVRFMDSRGKVRKYWTVDLNGDPILTKKECPEMFEAMAEKDREAAEARERELAERRQEEVLRKQAEFDIAKIDKQIANLNKSTPADNGMGQIMTAFLTMIMEQNAQRDKDRRDYEERRDRERLEFERERREHEKEMREIMLSNRSQGSDGSVVAAVIGTVGNIVQAALNKDSSGSGTLENAVKILTPFIQQPKDDRMAEVLRMIIDTRMHSVDITKDLFLAIMNMTNDDRKEETPMLEVARMLLGTAERGLNMWRAGSIEKMLLPAAGVAPQPAPAAPQAGPAPNPPGTDAFRGGASAAAMNQTIIDGYRASSPRDKTELLIKAIVMESEAVPLPRADESSFCELALDESTPDYVLEWLVGIESAADLRRGIHEDVVPLSGGLLTPEMLRGLDALVFQSPDKCRWIESYLEYVKSNVAISDVEDEGEEEEGEADEADAADGNPANEKPEEAPAADAPKKGRTRRGR